jgi:flavin-dependent dehydrogenase
LKIAIAGAGLTGAYLFRILRHRGHEIDVFDREPTTRCGISPCAWGTSRGFAELVKASGLDPEKYFLRHFDYVLMDGLRIAADLTTFNKPELIEDLLSGARIKYSPIEPTDYERIIDATGVSRAFLPPLQEDILLPCIQWRIRTDARLENRIQLGKIGYAWCFPLANQEYHIGCGSLISNPRQIMEELGWAGGNASGSILCACAGKIRLTAPQYSQPFMTKEKDAAVWGVGEAVGCVAPLAGDGVVPGMKSVQILMESWDDPGRYTEALLREFRWMTPERKVINKLRGNGPLGIKEAWILRKNSKRMGMKVGLKEAGMLVKNLR